MNYNSYYVRSAHVRNKITNIIQFVGFEVLTAVVMKKLCRLGNNAVQSVESKSTVRRNMSPPSSVSKNKPRKKSARL
jgi:hypothetical protein